MGFFLFLLVNATLFMRPAELIPGLASFHVYEMLIIACFLVTFPQVFQQLSLRDLELTPISLGLLIMLACCGLSHVMQLNLLAASDSFIGFFKVVVYYWLLVGLVNTPERIRFFLYALAFFVTVLALIAVLRYYEVIVLTPPPMPDTPNAVERTGKTDLVKLVEGEDASAVPDEYFDDQTGESKVVRRLRGTGIFNDPNDLCLPLVLGILVSLLALNDPHLGVFRIFALAPIGLFVFALRLTSSRGGLLGLLSGLAVLFVCRFGWKRALAAGALALPAVLALFGGRMMSMSATEGTGQLRLQLWRDGMVLFKESPFFGIGMDCYGKYVAHVAHNSFVHVYTELGFVGGTIFLGMFVYAFWALLQIRKVHATDPDMRRMLPFIVAIVAGYAGGIFSLTRCYDVLTYTILGLATAYLRIVLVVPPVSDVHLNGRMLLRMGAISLLFLLCVDLTVRFLAA